MDLVGELAGEVGGVVVGSVAMVLEAGKIVEELCVDFNKMDSHDSKTMKKLCFKPSHFLQSNHQIEFEHSKWKRFIEFDLNFQIESLHAIRFG